MVVPFISLAGSAARVASGNGDTLDLTALAADRSVSLPPSLRVQLDISAVSGTTPSLTVVIEDSLDGGQTFNVVGTFVAQTVTGRTVIAIAPSGVAQAAGFVWPFNARRLRARWTITGTTPSFTFQIRGVLL